MATKPNQACVLAVNGGSSSIKFALYQVAQRWNKDFMERLTALA